MYKSESMDYNSGMYKYRFFNDYSEGAHPKILELMLKNNDEQETGYGGDSFCEQAKSLIQKEIGNSDGEVHFVSGGTQANLIMLSAMLRPYESVIAASTAHIHVHEAGAIEACGHKINTIETKDGKLTVEAIQKVFAAHSDEHMVKPKAVFISNATELGTIYRRSELEAISQYCRSNNLYLYLDGARLGSAICSEDCDLDLKDLCGLVDAFYIGGTKNGALLGEAIVINSPEVKECFRYHLKQRGALLAKGRLLGLQFIGLFEDGLFFELAKHANAMAKKLSTGITQAGFKFLTESSTNQIFPILPNELIAKLEKDYGFYRWCTVDEDNSAIRLVTSWATKEEKVDEFLKDVQV